MGSKMQTEFALAETFGRSAGEQFKAAELEHDTNHKQYQELRKIHKELEAELDCNTTEVAEIYNISKTTVKPILMQYPLGMDLNDMLAVVATQTKRKKIDLFAYMAGRSDYWCNDAGIPIDPMAKFIPADGLTQAEFAYSYGEGWDAARRSDTRGTPIKAATNSASLN